MRLTEYTDGFDLALSGKLVLRHRKDSPALYLGAGEPTVRMNHGHFKVTDYLSARVPLSHAEVSASPEGTWRVSFAPDAASEPLLEMRISLTGDSSSGLGAPAGDFLIGNSLADRSVAGGVLELKDLTGGKSNRLWVRVPAESGERVWGGGEQLSYFDLRGRHFPLWTSEPGVGRDKTTLITFEADLKDGGGGDYYNTNYPQPTYISSRRYALHVDTTAYSAFDFRHDIFHEIEVWEIPARLEIWSAPHFKDLVSTLSLRFGRQPQLPDWVLQGAIIGLKEGERSLERLEIYAAADTAIAGLWCEDWVGIRQTSFGRRLFWDWKWNPERYPHLDRRIKDLREKGVRFMGYVNPYLCVDGSLYPQAAAAGYLAKKQGSDEPYSVDFGEFFCGIVDFTNPAAANWFADEVIGRNLLDFGLSGWMADFGEYLPTDVRLANGQDGMLAHNEWPVLWARVNADAVARRGQTGEALFFMRAGFSGVQRHCPLLWAGDQSVDFTRHDGLQTVIVAALSSGLLGNAYHHSDIGGYTSLFGNVRTAELIQRWAEMAAFTAVMRSHEGNRPQDNLQIDQDPRVLAHFARMTRIYRHLAPYSRMLSMEAVATGLPLQRPLFLHFEDDPRAYDSQTTYLYGADMLVAPVIVAEATTWRVYLPSGVTWVHAWSAKEFAGGTEVEVAAPLGSPPVFYRRDSAFAALFAELTRL